MKHFNSVQEAYIYSLNDIKRFGMNVDSVNDRNSVGSYFGSKRRDFREILGYSFLITSPKNRLIYSKSRKLSFGFSIANLIWLLSGRNDVETISFYNKKGLAYSGNGVYYEAAFGDRIFGSLNLWDAAKSLLLNDETSRRALMPIFIPTDLKSLPKDTPCASSIQVMIRNKKIDFFLHMRSQSVAMVFPYDLFLFTMLHEFISTVFDLPLGNFYYYCNSFHYYLEEDNLVSQIINETQYFPIEMESMPVVTNDIIDDIINSEVKLRGCISNKSNIGEHFFNLLPKYWANLMQVLYQKSCIEHNIESEKFENQYLSNELLYL